MSVKSGHFCHLCTEMAQRPLSVTCITNLTKVRNVWGDVTQNLWNISWWNELHFVQLYLGYYFLTFFSSIASFTYNTIWTAKIVMHVTFFSDPYIQVMNKDKLVFYCSYQYSMLFRYKTTVFDVVIDHLVWKFYQKNALFSKNKKLWPRKKMLQDKI